MTFVCIVGSSQPLSKMVAGIFSGVPRDHLFDFRFNLLVLSR